MLTIATAVLLSVISLTSAFVAHDAKQTMTGHIDRVESIESASPQEEEPEHECSHDDGTYDEGTFI